MTTDEQNHIGQLREVLANAQAEIARLRAELAERAKINTSFRLFDLVRFMRSELHQADLINDEEYAWLCGESPMSAGDGNGSPSRKRLEDYDKLQAELAELRGYVDATQVDSMRADNTHLRAEVEQWRQAEQLARVQLANEREMLTKCHMDNCRSIVQLAKELAAAREDSARLDWLELTADGINWQTDNTHLITRAAIDSARTQARSVESFIANRQTDDPARASHSRLTIEACGLRQSDAAAYALRLIGMMMQEAHTKGHCCGGTNGNASGKWEET